MTHGLPNYPHIGPSRGVSPPIQDAPPVKKTPVAKIATPALEQIKTPPSESSFLDRWVWEPIKKSRLTTYFENLNGSEDLKTLHLIFNDTSQMEANVHELAPSLYTFLVESLLKSSKKEGGKILQNNSEETIAFIEKLLLHTLKNGFLKTLTPQDKERIERGEPLIEPLKVEDVTVILLKMMAENFGKDFNGIDKQAMGRKSIDENLMRPVVGKLFNNFFPPGDPFLDVCTAFDSNYRIYCMFNFDPEPLPIQEELISFVASFFADQYKTLFNKLGDRPPEIKPDSIPVKGQAETMEAFEEVVRFSTKCFTESSRKEDIEYLKSRGIHDPEGILKNIPSDILPKLLQFVPLSHNDLNENVMDDVMQGLLLHGLATVAKDLKNPLDSATLLDEVLNYLVQTVNLEIASFVPSENVDIHSFSGSSARLMSLFIPDSKPGERNEWVVDFLNRRQKKLTEPLNLLLFQVYEDRQILKTKGIENADLLINQMSPAAHDLLKKFVPVMSDQMSEWVVLHALASIANEMEKNPLNLEDIFVHLVGRIHNEVKGVNSLENVTPASFTEGSFKILSLFVPQQNEGILKALEDKKEEMTDPLNQLMFQFYKTQEIEREVSEIKTRLLARIGDEKIVNQLHQFCITASMRSFDGIQDLLIKPETFQEILKGESKEASIAISSIFKSNHPEMEWLNGSAKQMLEIQLLKGMSCFLDHVPKKEGEKLDDILFGSFQILLDAGIEFLPDAVHQQNFQPLTNHLMDLFVSYDDFEKRTSPVGIVQEKGLDFINEFIAKGLATGVVFIHEVLQNKGENQNRLKEFYPSDHPTKMANLAGRMMRQGVPYLLHEKRESIALEILFPALEPFIGPLTEEQKKPLIEGLSVFLDKISSEKSMEMETLLNFIEQFTEAGFLQLLADYSQKISVLDKQGKESLLQEMAKSFLKGMNVHIEHRRQAVKDLAKQGEKNPTQDQIYEQYEKNEVIAKEINNPIERDVFYQRISHQMLMLLESNMKEKLPEEAEKFIEEKIVPAVLAYMVTEIQKPENLNQLLADLLAKAAESAGGDPIQFSTMFPSSSKIERRRNKRHAKELRAKEEYQKEIAAVLSELIKNSVHLQSRSKVIKAFGESEWLRNIAAETAADAFCGLLRNGDEPMSALEAIDQLMGVLLNLDPEEIFPLGEDKKLQEEARIKRNEVAEKSVPKFLRRRMRMITKSFVLDLFLNLWNAGEEWGHSNYPRLSVIIIPIINFFIKIPLSCFIFAIDVLVNSVIKAWGKLVFSATAKEFGDLIKTTTLGNLIFPTFSEIMDDVVKRQQSAS